MKNVDIHLGCISFWCILSQYCLERLSGHNYPLEMVTLDSMYPWKPRWVIQLVPEKYSSHGTDLSRSKWKWHKKKFPHWCMIVIQWSIRYSINLSSFISTCAVILPLGYLRFSNPARIQRKQFLFWQAIWDQTRFQIKFCFHALDNKTVWNKGINNPWLSTSDCLSQLISNVRQLAPVANVPGMLHHV